MPVNENLGDIRIQNEVVATIASIALADVDGIVSLSGKSFLDPLRSAKGPEKGVKAEIAENRVRLTLEVKIVYGSVIYDTIHRLQQTVKNAVEQMTGLIVDSVEVNVRDIVMENKVKKSKPGKEAGQSEEANG